MNYEAILDEAHAAAQAAIATLPPENPAALDCGFAWVTIGGNEPLARYCRTQVAAGEKLRAEGGCGPGFVHGRQRHYGSRGYPRGWRWWKPGDFPGQTIGHHIAGARAFQAVLAAHGIRADLGSRYD